MTSLPDSLPFIPLHDKVILPNIISEIVLCKGEREYLKHASRTPYFVCIPLKQQQEKNIMPASDISLLFHYGCTIKILDIDSSLPGTSVVRVQGLCASEILDFTSTNGVDFEVTVQHYQDEEDISGRAHDQFQSTCKEFIEKMELIGVSSALLFQFSQSIKSLPISKVANLLISIADVSFFDRLAALEETDFKMRILQINHAIKHHLQSLCSLKGNHPATYDQIRKNFYLRYQANSLECNQESKLKQEDDDLTFQVTPDDDEELIELIGKLNDAKLPAYVTTSLNRDLHRVRRLSPASSDSGVIRIYLEWVANLPWYHQHDSNVNIAAARHQLDADHYGIEQVKKRILEYLSVIKVKSDAKPPVLCFVGPPGVGKTTLAQSIAVALQRKFHRISLGGVRDEAEIRGHRRTYVGALPGLLIHSMRQCGVQNPVLLLDEIDKIAQGSQQGDPAAALLEVLDPAQSSSFTDHFLNLPYDLSKVTFIATANSLESIPAPLLDRLEVIQLSGYTYEEKLNIAQAHLIPKQIKAHGLNALQVPDNVVMHLSERYTRESGVRNLDRLIAGLCRYKCREFADLQEAGKLELFENCIDKHDVEIILGPEPFDNEIVESDDIPGVITGLAYSGSGNGGIMPIEASYMPGNGRLKLTGSLGEVIKESAELAVSWVKSNAFALKLTSSPKQDVFKDIDLHIHLPGGAVPKDGPSAGITMVICLISLLSGECVLRSTAMTGEVTLRGQVRPVGGIKEKVISAHRAGVKKVLLPAVNRRDVQNDIPKSIQDQMSFVYCRSIWDAVHAAFESTSVRFEPRLTSSL